MNPVLIIGAGPVGLTMACELTRFGVPNRIVDARMATSLALQRMSAPLSYTCANSAEH